MSNNDMNRTVREFYKAVEGVKPKKTGGYDVQATVRRVEDGVAWVHIPDGVDETPARLTINAKEGDVVQVRVVNGRAFLVGNASAPPTDNTEATKAKKQVDAVSQYVSTHVSTSTSGLSVLSATNGWRVLVSTGAGSFPAGVFLIDPNGNVAQQTTINGVEFNTGRAVKIGDQTAYINFDGNGHINVVGADLTIGGADNISGVLTIKDANGNTIGTINNTGANIRGTITAKNGNLEASLKADSSRAYTIAKNNVTAISMEALPNGGIGIFETPTGSSKAPIFERLASSIHTPLTFTAGYDGNNYGVTVDKNGNIVINGRDTGSIDVGNVLKWKSFTQSTEAAFLAAVDSEIGSNNGFLLGYMSATCSSAAGLSNVMHYCIAVANSINSRMLFVLRPTGTLYTRYKSNGTWVSGWKYVTLNTLS